MSAAVAAKYCCLQCSAEQHIAEEQCPSNIRDDDVEIESQRIGIDMHIIEKILPRVIADGNAICTGANDPKTIVILVAKMFGSLVLNERRHLST